MRRRVLLAVALLAAGCGTTVPSARLASSAAGGSGLSLTGNGSSSVAQSSAGTPSAPTSSGAQVTAPGTNQQSAASATNEPLSSAVSPLSGSTPTGTTPTGPVNIPPTGPGWNRSSVYLGMPYQDVDASGTVLDALGIKGLGLIDYQSVSKAVLNDVNGHGGLFGRAIVPVFEDFPPVPDATGQAECVGWTQDHHVIAVTDSFYNTSTVYGCLAAAGIPFSNSTVGEVDQQEFDAYHGDFHKLNGASSDTLFPTWMNRLAALGYFDGWNTSNGTQSSAPVKVGLLCTTYFPASQRDCALTQSLLAARGYAVASTYNFDPTDDETEMPNAVLRFKSAGITHVVSESTDVLYFMEAAQQQAYRPRYALSSLNAPTFLASNAPAAQLIGALGVGFLPEADVSQPPALGAAQAHCLQVLKAAGIDVVDSGGITEVAAFSICDAVNLYVLAARAGGGLSSSAILNGMQRIDGVYQSANVFVSGFSATRDAEAAAVRDLEWSTKCNCFAYADTTNWPS